MTPDLRDGRQLFAPRPRTFALVAWLLGLALLVNGLVVWAGMRVDPPDLASDPLQPLLPAVLVLGGALQLPAGAAFRLRRRDVGVGLMLGAWFTVALGAEVVGAAAATMTFVSFAYVAGVFGAVLFERAQAVLLVGLVAATCWVAGLLLRYLIIGERVGADATTEIVLIVASPVWFMLIAGVIAAALRSAQATVGRLDRVNSELELARGQADEASAAKSRFLANMSHELRTPLNAIIGYSELLIEEEATPKAVVGDVRQVHLAGTHLLGLVNDVLDMSAIEAGKMQLEPEETSVSQLFDGLVGTVEPLIREAGNTLRVEVEPDVSSIWVDPRRLRQVLFNLVANAAKYTEDGEVQLVGRRAGSGIEIDVVDTGVGIEPERLKTVFEPFVRDTDATANAQRAGTGLGLTIVRELVGLMDGKVTVHSQLGRGSRFTVWLPEGTPELDDGCSTAPPPQGAAQSPP